MGDFLDNSTRPYLTMISYAPHKLHLRELAYTSFQGLGVIRKDRIQVQQYYDYVSKSMFNVSPPGWGDDCYRHYESILLGAVPIVQNSTLWPIYDGNPVYLLEDWANVTEQQFRDWRPPSTSKKVAMAPYWFDRLTCDRDRYLAKHGLLRE